MLFTEEPKSIHDTVLISLDKQKLQYVLNKLCLTGLLEKSDNSAEFLGALSEFLKSMTKPWQII